MPSSPQELLSAAEGLAAESAEPLLRAAISRAYYSAYHYGSIAVQNELPLINALSLKGAGGSHEQLITKMLMAKTPRWTGAAYKLRDLKSQRVTADYQLDSEVTQARAFEAIESAKVIFKTLA
jgi:hypothetical protein